MKEPAITLRLSLDDAVPETLLPFRLPRRWQVVASDLDGGLVSGLTLSLRGELAAGHYHVPITEAGPLGVDIPDGARFTLELRADRRVRTGALTFDPPLPLGNVLGTLAHLPDVFEDRALASLKGWATRSRPGRALVDGLGGLFRAALRPHSAGAAAAPAAGLRVHLQRVTLRARGAALDLHFDGQVDTPLGVRVPFAGVRLPHAVVPALHADLERLLSPRPLATAELFMGAVQAEPLVRTCLRAVARAAGEVTISGQAPRLALELRLGGGGLVRASQAPLGALAGRAQLAVTREGDLVAVDIERAVVEHASGRLQLAGDVVVDLAEAGPPVIGAVDLTLAPGSHIGGAHLTLHHHHPLATGAVDLAVAVERLAAVGTLGAGGPHAGAELAIGLSGHLLADSRMANAEATLTPEGAVRVDASIDWDGDVGAAARVSGEVALGAAVELAVDPLPELAMQGDRVTASVDAEASFDMRLETGRDEAGHVYAALDGSRVSARPRRLQVEWAPLSLSLPAGALVAADVDQARLAADGLGSARLHVRWEAPAGARLRGPGAEVELLPPRLYEGGVVVAVSPRGGLTLADGAGDLLAPARLGEVLDDGPLVDRLLAASALLSPELGRLARAARRFERRLRAALDAERVEAPRDLIPRAAMARVMSRVLAEDLSLVDRLEPLIAGVTEGEGLDVHAAGGLIEGALPAGDHAYELDQGLRWLADLLGPTACMEPRERVHAEPLAQDPRFAAQLASLPSAAVIYATVGDPTAPLPPGFADTLARVAPYLTVDQLAWILSVERRDWPQAARSRLRYVLALKRRVRVLERGYGGLDHLPQALAIGFFLGDALTVARAEAARDEQAMDALSPGSVAAHVLGPEEVALLLQAGLTPVWQGHAVQVNQRLLLDFMLDQPAAFTWQVMAELGGGGGAPVLASALNALLDLEQSLMKAPLDLRAELSDRLGVALPRRADFMAGGPKARQSYYGALYDVAETLLAELTPYRALEQHLRVAWAPAPAGDPVPAAAQGLEAAARAAVEAADAQAATLSFDDEGAAHESARGAYRGAFEACAALLVEAPRAFERPWLADFWRRNHEALMVRSVVDNHREDVDEVRRWLDVRLGRAVGEAPATQALVDAVVEALYWDADDRAAVAADPLVRLLIPHPPGQLDFSVVSCMGVITEGAEGRELEAAYARLARTRGVRVVRADTETMRPLQANAAHVERAIRRCQGPWGYIGYSQGCANGLAAEARLMSGTPEQRALADRLVCRNLLFSAANGSAHGTCSDAKLRRAMVDGDMALKHYQALFSTRLIDLGVRALRLALDARPVVLGMRGAKSLTHDGVVALFRDGRFRAGVPTSVLRGVVDPSHLPEALELLSNLLTRQTGDPRHDTQVHVHEAVGHPVWVDNAEARALARADLGTRPQASHHWSPLVHEVGLITTERDRERAVYDGPKDRHVFPWIEVNARFGLIRPRRDSARQERPA